MDFQSSFFSWHESWEQEAMRRQEEQKILERNRRMREMFNQLGAYAQKPCENFDIGDVIDYAIRMERVLPIQAVGYSEIEA